MGKRSSSGAAASSSSRGAGGVHRLASAAAAVIAALVALAAGLAHLKENLAYHQHLSRLPDNHVAQVVSLQTENGFYYSYYGDLVSADSIGAGLQEIIWDTRSEYPDTLNAFRRFNIYQEVTLALIYRGLRSIWLAPVDPWDFFRFTLMVHTSIGQAALALLSSEVSGNAFAGIALFLLCFMNRFQTSRFGNFNSGDLREHWGIPLLWVQTVLLWHVLKGTSSRRLWSGFIVATFMFVVSWQFSPFLLLLQVTAVYFVCIVCGYTAMRPAVERLINAYLVAFVGAIVAQFFCPYLLTSPFLAQILGLKLATSLRSAGRDALTALGANRSALLRRPAAAWAAQRGGDVVEGLVAVVAFGLVMKAMAPFATADTHIYEILCTKAAVLNNWLPETLRLHERRLPTCAKPSFNAQLYLVMGVFKEIEESSLKVYRATTASPMAALSVVLILARCVLSTAVPSLRRQATLVDEDSPPSASAVPDAAPSSSMPAAAAGADGLRRRKGGIARNPEKAEASCAEPAKGGKKGAAVAKGAGSSGGEEDELEEAALLFFVAQFSLFSILGAFINRLRVAFAPPMMVLAASAFGPRLFAWGRRDWRWFVLLFVLHGMYLLHLVRLMPCPVMEDGLCKQMSDKKTTEGDLVDLIDWIEEKLPQSLPILASMNLAGTLRAFTYNPMVIHPQFESAVLRQRVQLAYEMYHCGSEESLAQTMHRLRAKVVIFELARCFFTPYTLDDDRKNCKRGKHLPLDQLCLKLFASPGLYQLIFANGGYAVFQVQDGFDGHFLSSMSQQEVAEAIEAPTTWTRYIDRCAEGQGDEACAARLAEFASTWQHGLKKPSVSKAIWELSLRRFHNDGILRYYWARHLDFDAGQTQDAGLHYEWAAMSMPNNALAVREYLMWLDMVAKDRGKVRKYLETRSTTSSSGERFLDLDGAGAAELCCEAAVSAKDVGLTDLSKKLWAKARKIGPFSSCLSTNWQLMEPGTGYDEAFGIRERIAVFFDGGVQHEVGSHHGPSVRHAESRRNRRPRRRRRRERLSGASGPGGGAGATA